MFPTTNYNLQRLQVGEGGIVIISQMTVNDDISPRKVQSHQEYRSSRNAKGFKNK